MSIVVSARKTTSCGITYEADEKTDLWTYHLLAQGILVFYFVKIINYLYVLIVSLGSYL